MLLSLSQVLLNKLNNLYNRGQSDGALQLLISEGGIFYGRLPDAAVRNFFGFCGRCESAEMLRIAGEKSDANSTIHISSGKVSQNTVLGKHVLRTGFEYGS